MEDFLRLDQQLNEEERLIRDSVNRFVDDAVIPKMANAYETAKFPMELIPQIAELGLL